MKEWITTRWRMLQIWLDGDHSPAEEGRLDRLFAGIVLGWILLWTLLPAVFIGNLPIDVAENVVWGSHLAWGYDKNPYFGAQFTYWMWRVLPYEWIGYLLSQLSAGGALWCVYRLGKRLFASPFRAFTAAVLLLAVPFFSHSANEFNDDVMGLLLWAAMGLFAHRAITELRFGDWLAVGILSGCALMTKYLAVVGILPFCLLLLITEEGRRNWQKPGIWAAFILFLALVLPNVWYLWQTDFGPILYAFERADLTEDAVPWSCHFTRPWELFTGFFGRLAAPAVLLLLLFRRDPAAKVSPFNRSFILWAGLFPIVFSLLFSAVTGGSFLVGWTTPYYVFATLVLVLVWPPENCRRRFRVLNLALVIATTVIVLFFGYEYLYKRPYRKKGWVYYTYPGRKVADRITAAWHAEYGCPIPYVVGPRTEACYLMFYSPDHPDCLFDGQLQNSPWFDLAALRRHGGVILYDKDHEAFLKDASALHGLQWKNQPPFRLHRELPGWFRPLVPPTQKDVVIFYAFIPPAGK